MQPIREPSDESKETTNFPQILVGGIPLKVGPKLRAASPQTLIQPTAPEDIAEHYTPHKPKVTFKVPTLPLNTNIPSAVSSQEQFDVKPYRKPRRHSRQTTIRISIRNEVVLQEKRKKQSLKRCNPVKLNVQPDLPDSSSNKTNLPPYDNLDHSPATDMKFPAVVLKSPAVLLKPPAVNVNSAHADGFLIPEAAATLALDAYQNRPVNPHVKFMAAQQRALQAKNIPYGQRAGQYPVDIKNRRGPLEQYEFMYPTSPKNIPPYQQPPEAVFGRNKEFRAPPFPNFKRPPPALNPFNNYQTGPRAAKPRPYPPQPIEHPLWKQRPPVMPPLNYPMPRPMLREAQNPFRRL